jgi:hypothetical protein
MNNCLGGRTIYALRVVSDGRQAQPRVIRDGTGSAMTWRRARVSPLTAHDARQHLWHATHVTLRAPGSGSDPRLPGRVRNARLIDANGVARAVNAF